MAQSQVESKKHGMRRLWIRLWTNNSSAGCARTIAHLRATLRSVTDPTKARANNALDIKLRREQECAQASSRNALVVHNHSRCVAICTPRYPESQGPDADFRPARDQWRIRGRKWVIS